VAALQQPAPGRLMRSATLGIDPCLASQGAVVKLKPILATVDHHEPAQAGLGEAVTDQETRPAVMALQDLGVVAERPHSPNSTRWAAVGRREGMTRRRRRRRQPSVPVWREVWSGCRT